MIAGLIIAIIFASAAIYDYYKNESIHNMKRNQGIVDSCMPGQDMTDKSTELIQNGTHIFLQQTCTWIKSVNHFIPVMVPKS